MIKSCIETEELDKSIEIFGWLKEYKYTLQIHEKFITKLIGQCGDDHVDYLRYIFSLITDNVIQCKSEMIIKTSLIIIARIKYPKNTN